jgi:hypothetical protein
MKRTHRLLVAVASPLIVSILLGIGAWFYVDVLGEEVSERATMILAYLFAWPQLFLKPFTPGSDSPYPNAARIRILLFIVSEICVWFTYSLLIYAILSWRDRRKGRKDKDRGQA